MTSFVGRDDALDAVGTLVMKHRLVTLIGSGGCGKTRLAIEVAGRLEPTFADAGAFVDVAPVDSPGVVPSVVAAAVGIPEAGAAPVPDLIANALADRHTLLVMDNCERMVDACADLIHLLLHRCESLVVLATSRVPLAVDGEVTWRVPSLSLPAEESTDPLNAVCRSEAGCLLIDRARLAHPGFALSPDTAEAAVTICRRLDGMPLAIELAASRLRALGVRDLAQGLEDRFHLLSSGPRTAPARQRTLEASIAWSHDLLGSTERLLFRRLAVFASAFRVEDAEAVCAGDALGSSDILTVMASLVDQSLLQRHDDGTGTPFRFLETVREFAGARLAESGEDEVIRDRHLKHLLRMSEWFCDLAEGPELSTANERLAPLIADIRSALEWCVRSGRVAAGRRLASDIRVFWVSQSRCHEAATWYDSLLAAGDLDEDLLSRTRAQLAAAEMYLETGDPFTQAELAREALEGARQLADPVLEARALSMGGWARIYTDPDEARSMLHAARSAAEEADDLARVRSASFGLGTLEVSSGDLSLARQLFERGIAIELGMGGFYLEYGSALLAYVDTLEGNLATAITSLEAILSQVTQSPHRMGHELSTTILAVALTHRGEYARARELLDAAISSSQAVGSSPAYSLLQLALLERALGNHAEAAGLIDEVGPIVQLIGPWFGTQALVCRADAAAAGAYTASATELRAQALSTADNSSSSLARTIARLSMARGERQQGNVGRARDHARATLEIAVGAGFRIGAIDALEVLGTLPGDESATLLAAVDAARADCGYVRFPVDEPEYRAAVARAGTIEVDPGPSFDDGVALVLGPDALEVRPPTGWHSLTPAELRVARLVATGMTNPEIGDHLFISRRTVQAHLSHIFAKLSIGSRAELATIVSQQDDAEN